MDGSPPDTHPHPTRPTFLRTTDGHRADGRVVADELTAAPVAPIRHRTGQLLRAVLVVTVAFAATIGGSRLQGRPDASSDSAVNAAGAGGGEVRIFLGAPTTLDPALQGDSGSAAITAQLFESLTTFDDTLTLRPALAQSWRVDDGGKRITFTLRPGLTFSDGTRLTAADVVRSWLRVDDPRQPSPLASLMDVVDGSAAYRRGEGSKDAVGLRAVDDSHVEVRLARAASDFPSVVASPTFGIVPSRVGQDATALQQGVLVASGGYRLAAETATELTLQANTHYWAGTPPIKIVHILTSIGGRSPVAAFEAGDIDYTSISDFDARWIRYDAALGPQLRDVPSLSLVYFGFDTRKPPFDDARVRRAFAQAVDWKRIVALTDTEPTTPATSMVPPGVPGRSERDFGPVHDPGAARKALADAGYPGGRGFPQVILGTGGTGFEEAIVRQLKDVLGVSLTVETMPFDEYFDRLAADPPAFWSLSWVADYPGSNDFLGLLLGTDQTNDYGHWSNPQFDAAITRAATTADPTQQTAAFEAAQTIVQSEAPVVPVAYGTGWALSRKGLLGAGQNGLGLTRMAGLAWQP
jgi:ABC-type transport system substrate-binding protein